MGEAPLSYFDAPLDDNNMRNSVDEEGNFESLIAKFSEEEVINMCLIKEDGSGVS